MVQRYIHSVIEGDVDPKMGLLTGVLYETTARGSPFAAGPARYAAYLVRRAIGERQSLGFAVRSSSRALVAILKRKCTLWRSCDVTQHMPVPFELKYSNSKVLPHLDIQ